MNKSNALRKADTKAKVATPAPLGTPVVVRGKLALLGWPSLAAWGEAHGYARTMATYVVKTWGQRADGRQPHGGIARQLMNDLRHTLDTNKRPEDMPNPSDEA